MFLCTLTDYYIFVSLASPPPFFDRSQSSFGVSTGTAPFHFFRLFDRDGRRLFLGIPEVLVHRQPNNSNRMNLSQAMQRPETLSGGGGGGAAGWRDSFGSLKMFLSGRDPSTLCQSCRSASV